MNTGHGLEEYTRYLDALDGRVVRVTATSLTAPTQAGPNPNLEREVRRIMERLHRRQMIAEG